MIFLDRQEQLPACVQDVKFLSTTRPHLPRRLHSHPPRGPQRWDQRRLRRCDTTRWRIHYWAAPGGDSPEGAGRSRRPPNSGSLERPGHHVRPWCRHLHFLFHGLGSGEEGGGCDGRVEVRPSRYPALRHVTCHCAVGARGSALGVYSDKMIGQSCPVSHNRTTPMEKQTNPFRSVLLHRWGVFPVTHQKHSM